MLVLKINFFAFHAKNACISAFLTLILVSCFCVHQCDICYNSEKKCNARRFILYLQLVHYAFWHRTDSYYPLGKTNQQKYLYTLQRLIVWASECSFQISGYGPKSTFRYFSSAKEKLAMLLNLSCYSSNKLCFTVQLLIRQWDRCQVCSYTVHSQTAKETKSLLKRAHRPSLKAIVHSQCTSRSVKLFSTYCKTVAFNIIQRVQ